MLYFVSTTKGIIIMSILGILFLIPIWMWIHKPEYIVVDENGRPKIKETDLFYNLPLQNPIYIKLALLLFGFIIVSSLIMFHYGVDVEIFEMFFKFFMLLCYILIGVQILEERKTILFGFAPIIIKITRFLKEVFLIILGILYLIKIILLAIVNIFFILPFKLLYKILGIK